MSENYTLYLHRNKLNGKVYIGVTGRPVEQRWSGGHGYHSNQRFYQDIEKYGWDQFSHIVLASGMPEELAHEKEIQLISIYHSTDPKCGYNQSTGGRGGRSGVPLSPEVLERLRRLNTGRKVSEETRQKLRLAQVGRISSGMKGKHHSESTRKHLSEIGKTKTGALNSFYGRKHSDESKQKMRAAKIGRTLTPEHVQKVSDALSRAVLQFDLSGNLIREYKSTVEASLDFAGTKYSHIPDVCNGKRKTAFGYVWKYAEVV